MGQEKGPGNQSSRRIGAGASKPATFMVWTLEFICQSNYLAYKNPRVHSAELKTKQTQWNRTEEDPSTHSDSLHNASDEDTRNGCLAARTVSGKVPPTGEFRESKWQNVFPEPARIKQLVPTPADWYSLMELMGRGPWYPVSTPCPFISPDHSCSLPVQKLPSQLPQNSK